MKAYNRKDTCPLSDPSSNGLVTGVVEPSLRQNNGGTAAGLKKFEITFDEENITPDAAFLSSPAVLGDAVLMNNSAVFDITSKGGIGQEHVEVEIAVVIPVP